MSELNEFEAAIPERIARMSRERLEQGRRDYGAWEPLDGRDYLAEIEAELLDGLHYVQALREKVRKMQETIEVKLNSVTVDLRGGGGLGGFFDDIACDEETELRFFDAVETDEGDILCAHESFTEAVWQWHGGDTSRVTWGARTCEIVGMTATRCEHMRNGWKVPIEMWKMLTKENSDE